jgi:hypothetical protein
MIILKNETGSIRNLPYKTDADGHPIRLREVYPGAQVVLEDAWFESVGKAGADALASLVEAKVFSLVSEIPEAKRQPEPVLAIPSPVLPGLARRQKRTGR